MKKLSIIMPFLKEGLEPIKTIISINNTTNPDDVEIIAICDEAEYEHENIIKTFNNVKFVKNKTTMGIDASRSIGINLASAPSCLIIDGHMRFSNDNWVDKICEVTHQEPKTLWCTKSVVLKDSMTDEELNPFKDVLYTDRIYSVGAKIHVDKEKNIPFSLSWLNLDSYKKDIYINNEIPCVLGANYVGNTEWLKNARIFEGLLGYGYSEQYASIKNWLLGGTCKGLESVSIGHIFRSTRPYTVTHTHFLYNVLFTAYILFSEEVDFFEKYVKFTREKNSHNTQFEDAIQLLESRHDIVETYRTHAAGLKKMKMVDYLNYFNISYEDFYNEN